MFCSSVLYDKVCGNGPHTATALFAKEMRAMNAITADQRFNWNMLLLESKRG